VLGTGFIVGEIVMDENEWLVCRDQASMLELLRGKASDRKLRLFACACCHAIDHLLTDERLPHTLQIAEQFAEGQATTEDRQAARRQAERICRQSQVIPGRNPYMILAARDAAAAVTCAASKMAYFAAASAAQSVVRAMMRAALAGRRNISLSEPGEVATGHIVRKTQATLLHDLFGPLPLRPISLDAALLTPTVTALALSIYTDRNFSDLPVLADALEESGCTSEEILSHLRGPGPHCRGCWPLDLILGKA
jgi:hypothetical protein